MIPRPRLRPDATVRHSEGEYVRYEGDDCIHTNTVEGFFSILKRGINGVYHHVSEAHLQKYLNEFDFQYSNRERPEEGADRAFKNVTSKKARPKESSR
jgi:hypothetical protein